MNTLKAGKFDPENLASVASHFCQKGEDEPVLALIAKGADPNDLSSDKLPALFLATMYDRPRVVRALLDAKANPNLARLDGETALHRVKSSEIALMLIEAGADVNAARASKESGRKVGSPLTSAANSGNVPLAKVLIDSGANLNFRNDIGSSALTVAILLKKAEMVQFLLDIDAEVSLKEAALIGDCDQIQKLLSGASHSAAELGDALRCAAYSGSEEAIGRLLDFGIVVDVANDRDETPLMSAARSGKADAMRLLIERGAEVNARSAKGYTALNACDTRCYEAIELLLSKGADPNLCGESGWTPLISSCLFGETRTVELLLKHGADPNAYTDAEYAAKNDGSTNANALGMASVNGHIDRVKLLLEYGANPLAADCEGVSVLARLQRRVERKTGFKLEEITEVVRSLEARVAEMELFGKFEARKPGSR